MPPSDVQRSNITYFYNQVVAPLELNVNWESQRVPDSNGREVWCATLYVNGNPKSQGYGQRLGHAKDDAARRYLLDHGFIPPNPNPTN